MESNFKDNVKIGCQSICKKSILLKPFAVILMYVHFFMYYIYDYLKSNHKRLVTIAISIVFLFMSTSFTNISNSDAEVYITSSVDAETDFVNDIFSNDSLPSDNKVIILDDDDEIISTKLLSSEMEKSLESVENISTFTLEDFLSQFELNEDSDFSDDALSGFDKDAWYLILVNKTHPVPDDYEMELATISGSMKCDVRVLDILLNMLNGAQKDGVNLIVCSPYRDYELQKTLFNRKVDLYVANGYSYLDAYKLASQKVIVPGASEHQLGLAFDIVTDYHAVLDYEFGDTQAGQWLKKHCAEYGFILRYPRGKESITGIEYEPWHFRYVGVEAATYIMENGLTLEEFLEGL